MGLHIGNIPRRRLSSWHSLWRAGVIMLGDAVCLFCSYFLALWARFEFRYSAIDPGFLAEFWRIILPWIGITVFVYLCMGLYSSIWTFVGIPELEKLIVAQFILGLLGICFIGVDMVNMPRSFYCIGIVLAFLSTCGVHFSVRFAAEVRRNMTRRFVRESADNIMIVGAGAAGRSLLTEFSASRWLQGRVVCLIDDNPAKRGHLLEGVPVVGGRQDIPAIAEKYSISKIIFAIPSASAATRRDILNICSTTKCQIQAVPGIYQLVNGEISVSKLKKVDVQDLLGRDSVQVDMSQLDAFLKNKTVLVTGGGGSIGSELCRQIAKRSPKTLIIFDIYENNAYEIQMELTREYPELDLQVLIGSVRNAERVEWVLRKYRPELVFHAAAHKHVPLMEDSPNEAIKNNVFGTYNMATYAARYGVKKFVLISTDKAVNPTNIMGASKRLCEMVVQMMNRKTETEFAAVRFGNVLGSNGSVIPLFKKQIAAGGPVTITHPDITRFFMTIPEAVSLVLQAGCYAKGGEIFVLDMGEPVKIDDMARKLIRLSGLEPDVDIPVVYTGLRPGEKLYEELLMDEEGLQATENHLIHIGKPIEMDDEVFMHHLLRLENACEHEAEDIKDIVAEIVPTYRRKTQESQEMEAAAH